MSEAIDIRERPARTAGGLLALFLLFLLFLASAGLFAVAAALQSLALFLLAPFVWLASFLGLFGLFIVQPNQARVLQLFGSYVGSARETGLRWTNPFYTKKAISLRTRNFETGKLKVNDLHGNPIEIGAVVVWKVVDSAEALFNVDDYIDYVQVQSEAAVRSLATAYAYDAHETADVSLSGHTGEVSERLKSQVQDRLEKAGVEVIEARISHLAYAPEIAAAMLQRQQATAVVAARAKIVEGAVGMVDHALRMLHEQRIVELDAASRAQMVGNLLVVLCSDRHAQPVVDAGGVRPGG